MWTKSAPHKNDSLKPKLNIKQKHCSTGHENPVFKWMVDEGSWSDSMAALGCLSGVEDGNLLLKTSDT